MSIMFPTIFSLSITGLGSKTKLGSSLLIMSIVGGAVFPDTRIAQHPEQSKKYLTDSVLRLAELHEEHRTIWGDPWLGNTGYNEKNELVLFDFGFKSNPDASFEFLAAKDIIGLTYSAVYRTGIDAKELVPFIIDTLYRPPQKIKQEIRRLADRRINESRIQSAVANGIFYKPVFGMNAEEVKNVSKEIFNATFEKRRISYRR